MRFYHFFSLDKTNKQKNKQTPQKPLRRVCWFILHGPRLLKKKKRNIKTIYFFFTSATTEWHEIQTNGYKKQRLQIKFENQMVREKGRNFYKFT